MPSRPDLRRSRRCQIVLFVSSREMRLCGVSLFSSITIFRKLQNFLLPILTTSTSPSPRPACFSCRLRTLSRREPNYSKATTVAQGGKRNFRNLLIAELCCAINLLSSKAFVPSASFQIIPPFWHGNSNKGNIARNSYHNSTFHPGFKRNLVLPGAPLFHYPHRNTSLPIKVHA